MLAYFAEVWKIRQKQPPKFDLISMLAHGEAFPDRGDFLGQVLDPRAACCALGRVALVQTLKIVLKLGVSGFDELGQGRPREIAILVVDRLDPRAIHRQQLPAKQVQLATEQYKFTEDLAEARPSLRSTMFSEIQLAQSAPAAGTIQRQINHCCARTASNDCSF
jgi:hypothetical protein